MTATSSNDGTVGLLLSGGLDSSILLGHLLGKGRRVQPFYVRSHLLWEEAELRPPKRCCKPSAAIRSSRW